MKITFNLDLARDYTSKSQIIRVLSESWVRSKAFCPNCGRDVHHYENNRPVEDFYCAGCGEDYELKAGKVIGRKVVDGAYSTMKSQLQKEKTSNLFLLKYGKASNNIIDFSVIPSHFFTLEIIEKRKPLSETARRPGWVGYNIKYKFSILKLSVFHRKPRFQLLG